jgi:hypothetical protein
MKLPPIAKLRIPILLALAVGETFGLIHFYGRHGFSQFAVFSLEGILIIALPLWFSALRKRGVPGFDIIIAVFAGASAIGLSGIAFGFWGRREKADALAGAGTVLFIATAILLKLLRPRHGPVARDAITFFGYSILAVWTWSSNASILWKAVVALPILWFVWRVVFHFRSRQRVSSQPKAITDIGGRA